MRTSSVSLNGLLGAPAKLPEYSANYRLSIGHKPILPSDLHYAAALLPIPKAEAKDNGNSCEKRTGTCPLHYCGIYA